MEPRPGSWIGPEGYGDCPEIGGDREYGEKRVQSTEPFGERLTASVKEEVRQLFTDAGVEVKKVDKTSKSRIRVWYNGNLHVPYPKRSSA